MKFVILFLFLVISVSFVSGCGDGQIDINSAPLSELDKLSGIGEVKAQAIIDSRPYDSIDDLSEIYGIGEATLEKIKQQGLACVEYKDVKDGEEIVEEEDNKLVEEPEKEIVVNLNENIIKLNEQKSVEQNSITGKVIYESKDEKIKNKAIYFFAGFLILVIVILLIWR